MQLNSNQNRNKQSRGNSGYIKRIEFQYLLKIKSQVQCYPSKAMSLRKISQILRKAVNAPKTPSDLSKKPTIGSAYEITLLQRCQRFYRSEYGNLYVFPEARSQIRAYSFFFRGNLIETVILEDREMVHFIGDLKFQCSFCVTKNIGGQLTLLPRPFFPKFVRSKF